MLSRSQIANHGHLVVISAIYDPAFYYTNSKMEEKGVFINIELVVERPFLYIFTRSSSSLDDQAHIYNLRTHDLADMDADLHTDAGVPVHDVIQFFHGDGPAQQVKAGAKIGGNYICVGCTAESSWHDDIAYCYRCDTLAIADPVLPDIL